MVAIVTGKGVGLERSSAFVLGSQGQLGSAALGRDGGGVFVNAANGNFMVTRQDEFLIGQGSDLSLSRAYNSKGDADGQYWRTSAYRKVTGLTGSYGATGSTVTRIDWDGSDTLYTWNATENAYVATDGKGAYDTLTRSGTTWTWTDGDTLTIEQYDGANGGRIVNTKDRDGIGLTYSYSGALITRITTASGEYTDLVYDGGSRLISLATTKTDGSLTRVRYAYDGLGRLSTVTVDLSPDGGSIADGNTYVTTYTYDGTSARIASIGQQDGTLLQIAYVDVGGGDYRVSSYTQTVAAGVTRTTSFSYGAGQTTVTDPAGQKTVLFHDADGNLTAISHPPEGNGIAPRTVQFDYNERGDVVRVIRGPGNVVTYDYDSHGNLVRERDSAGNTIERFYGPGNELRREVRYLVPDPDGAGSGTPSGPLVTRYAYDNEGHLRFIVSAEGNVTEYRYDSPGNRIATIDYLANRYDISGLGPADLIGTGLLIDWVNAITDKSTTQRTEFTYDFRGNVKTVASHEKVQANGSFDTGSQKSETTYVYDQAGNLLQRIVANPAGAGTLSETYVYDGLNRLTLATDFHGAVTRTSFLDARAQTVITHANGLSEISTYNRAGERVAFSTSSAGGNLVDLAGWPGNPASLPGGSAHVPGWINWPTIAEETIWASTTGPDGLPVAAIHAGQTDGDLQGGGNFTNKVTIDGSKAYEFVYYFKLSDPGKHDLYFGPTPSSLAYVEDASTGADVTSPYFLVRTAANQSMFAAGKWYKVVGYVLAEGASPPAAPLGGVYDVETGQKVSNIDKTFRWNDTRPDNAVDSRFFTYDGTANQQYSTYFYQAEIREVTAPSPSGPDVQTSLYRYDALGRLRMTVDPTGRRAYMMYDAVGRKIADIDADGSVIEYRYDGSDNLTSTTRYANKLSANQLASLVDASGNPTGAAFASLRPAADSVNDRWTWQVYDAAQRLVQTIDGTGATIVYTYDGASRLTATTAYASRVSTSVLNGLKAAALDPNSWLNPDDGTLWGRGNLSVAQAGTIEGANAFKFTVLESGVWQGVNGNAVAVAAGETVTYTLWVKGVGGVTTHRIGLFGSGTASYGESADSSAAIVSGPGTVTQITGGIFLLEGLSTTQATRVTVTRTFTEADLARGYFYILDSSAASVAGDAAIIAAPVFTRYFSAPVGVPAADAANDRVTRSFYDADGRLIGTLDGEGYLTRIVHDNAGRTTKTIAYSGLTSAGLRASGTFQQLLDSITLDNAKDIHTHFVHDARGLLRAVVDGEGNLTRYHYNPLGDVSQVVTGQKLDPAALLTTPPTLANLPAAPGGTVLQTISYERTAYGDVTRETRSLTGSTSTITDYTYDAMRRLTKTVTQSGGADPRVMTQRYDLRGNITGTLSGIGNASLPGSPTQAQIDAAYASYGTTYIYDKADRLISSTDPNGSRTLYYYDADGRLTFQIDALGHAIEYRYDSFGQRSDVIAYGIRIAAGTLAGMSGGTATTAITAIVHALADVRFSQTIHLDFNLDGTVKQSTNSLAHVTSFTYNAFGEVVSRTDPFGTSTTIVTNLGYDRRGLLKAEIVDAASGGKAITTSYGYDAFGRPVTLTDAQSHTATSVYDRAGRLVSATDALNNTTQFKYDARGNLVWIKDARDNVTRYVYDNAGRRTWAVDAGGGVVQTGYDDDGRVLVTRAYAVAISLSGLGEQISDADVAGRVTADDHDRIMRNAYDKDGRLRFVVDGVSALTEYGYDDAGNVIRTLRYGGALDPTSDYTIAYIEGQIASKGLAALPQTRVSRTVYDAVGRVAYSIAADGAVVQFRYEYGGITRQRAFVALYTAGGDPSLATMDGWAAGSVHEDDRVTRALYDSEGRLAYDIDAENFVTRYVYDKSGNVTQRIRYAGNYAVLDSTTYWSMDALVGGTVPATAAVTEFKYDSAGRLTEIVDPIGGRTVMTLDQLGRILTSTAAYGTAAASTTTYTYDNVGRVLTVRAQIDGNTAHDLVTTNLYDAVGNLVKVTDAGGGISYSYYDAVGRVIQQLDAEKYGTDYSYTVFGEVAAVKRYALRADNSPSETVPPTFTANALDATTSFEYDRRGLLTKVTDAEGHSEQYALDEFGNRATVTNKLGHAIVYTYDKLNRMLTETLPVNVIRASDGVVLATSVRNDFVYDAFGNLLARIEAANRPSAERRTTLYDHDKMGRVVTITHDAVTVYSDALAATANVVPTETFVYDARGNLVLATDAAGRQTFSYYDLADRKTDEVAAMEVQAGPTVKGVLSHWEYDGRGNVTSVRVYGDLVTMPAGVASALPTPGTAYRETVFTYDKAGRQLTSTVSGLRFGSFDGTSYAVTGATSLTTQRVYDAYGNVIKEIDGAGAVTWSWYNKLGHKTAQIDRENYLTVWQRDANGNAVSETRYASKITGSFDTSTGYYGPLLALVTPDAALDRSTTFTYDRNGNRLSERRWYVDAATVSSVGQLTTSTQTAIILYTYNALGLVASRREANNDLTEFEYDKIGRLAWVKDPAFMDNGGLTVRRMTESFYDALGNLARTEVNKVGGAAGDDRVTFYVYGPGGRLASVTDATGFTRGFGYDAAGRLVMESWTRTKSDLSTQVTEAIGYRYDLAGRLVTQAAASWNGSAWTFGEATRIRYNAHGEVTGRGITASPAAAAVYQETFDYDAGGRLWRSNEGGVLRFHLYDKAGNATLTLASAGADLSTLTFENYAASLTTAGGTGIADAVTTIATFDKRGQQLSAREPDRQLGHDGSGFTLATLVSSRAYNAYGEVVSETDARSNTTEFRYNTLGRLIEKKSPEVAWTAESGAVADARPTETWHYDISGRLVGIDNANHHQGVFNTRITRALVAGTGHNGEEALVAAEFKPDGGVARTFYDVFGDARVLRNELFTGGNHAEADEYRFYDKLGRLTGIQHRGHLLTDHYVHDVLGRRIRHWNSQLGSGVVARTDYDLQGRVSAQTDMTGAVTSYAYAWSASLATAGMGIFGGWTKTTTNVAASKSMTESLDYFGRTVARTDYGSNGTSFTYDHGGRLITQTGAGGQSLAYAWLNTGLAYRIVDTAGSGKNVITARYAYDEAGNRTYEGHAGTVYSFHFGGTHTSAATTLQNATITYDALGRITAFTDRDAGGTVRITVETEYDKVGNVRRNRSTFPELVYGGTQSPDQWYRYDAMNRMVAADGRFTGIDGNGQPVSGDAARGIGTIGGGDEIVYDAAGQRISATRFASLSKRLWKFTPNAGPVRYYPERNYDWDHGTWLEIDYHYVGTQIETYAYRADGALASVHIAEQTLDFVGNGQLALGAMGPAALRAEYTRDAMGRLTRYREFEADGTTVSHDRWDIVYVANSNLVDFERTSQKKKEGGATNTYVTYLDNTYSAAGLLTFSSSDNYKNGVDEGSNGMPDVSTTFTYTWYDDARVATTTFDADTNSGSNPTWTSTYAYDGLGRVASVNIADGRPRTVSMAYTPEGQMLRRKEKSAAAVDPEDMRYFVRGMQVGELTNNGFNDPDFQNYAKSLDLRNLTDNPVATPFRWNTMSPSTRGTFGTSAGYDPISPHGNGARTAGSSHVVRDGDTLQSIALAAWGDASLWYLIAEANGLVAGSQLIAGQSLILPDRVTNARNNADTFKVYDPNRAMGDLSPTTPKPPKNNKCGMVGTILVSLVSIAIAAVLPVAAPGVFGAGALGGMGSVATAVAASAGSQAFGVATGIRSSFDWKGVAMAGVTAGVGLGMGKLPGIGPALGGPVAGSPFLGDVARGVARNALSQGIGVAAGLQDRFDWAGVAAAGVIAGTGGAMAHRLGGAPLPAWMGRSIVGTTALAAGAGARAAVTGTSFGDNIMAVLPDVIATTIGDIVGAHITLAGERGRDPGTQTAFAGAQTFPWLDQIRSDYNPYNDIYVLGDRLRSLLSGGFRSLLPDWINNYIFPGTGQRSHATANGGPVGGMVGATLRIAQAMAAPGDPNRLRFNEPRGRTYNITINMRQGLPNILPSIRSVGDIVMETAARRSPELRAQLQRQEERRQQAGEIARRLGLFSGTDAVSSILNYPLLSYDGRTATTVTQRLSNGDRLNVTILSGFELNVTPLGIVEVGSIVVPGGLLVRAGRAAGGAVGAGRVAEGTVVPRLGPRGIDPLHHNANVLVRDSAGNVVSNQRFVSGNMTLEEQALGFPRSTLASHTEARAVRSTELRAGDTMTITGQSPPCPSCKGAMNRTAAETGATIRYQWRQDGRTLIWLARPRGQ